MTEKAPKPQALWKKARGPITANPRMVELAAAINQLLVAPIAVLPASVEGIVKPFAVGIAPLMEGRLKPDAAVADLKVAVRKFARNRAYLLAVAQPDAMRHDIDGNPVEPVSEKDRMAAQVAFKIAQDIVAKNRKQREQEQAAA